MATGFVKVVCLCLFSSSCLLPVHSQPSPTPCCIQPEIVPDGCTTVAWCNQERDNCVGACEGTWSGDAPNPSPVVPSPVAQPAPQPTLSNGRSTFYFGHSLIYHTFTTQPNVNLLGVPYWMNQFALSKNENWLADGEFRSSNYPLPPNADWGFQPDISAWDGNSFASTGYDSMVYTELNYVQYKSPTEPYDYPNPDPPTPIGSALRILDYSPNTPLILYECWNDGASAFPQDFPGTDDDRDAYYTSTDFGSAYHLWWQSLYDELIALRPNADVTLVPVGPILVSVLRDFLPNTPFESIFEDTAPHGRPTAYLLAATVLYIAMTPDGELPSDIGFSPPTDGTILSDVVSQYSNICTYIEDLLFTSSPVAVPPSMPSATASPMAPLPSPVADPPSATASPVASSPTSSEPCCVQEEINGLDACTTIAYCNENESHCLGDCDGIWTVVTDNDVPAPAPAPVPSAVPPTTSSPVVVSPTTDGPVDEPCCVQEEINGSDACTTIAYCNENESHCLGDCEGIWTVVTDDDGPAPAPSPVPPTTASPVVVSPTSPVNTPCCIQEEINGPDACTTVPYCNENESNCIGNCEGIWTVVP